MTSVVPFAVPLRRLGAGLRPLLAPLTLRAVNAWRGPVTEYAVAGALAALAQREDLGKSSSFRSSRVALRMNASRSTSPSA